MSNKRNRGQKQPTLTNDLIKHFPDDVVLVEAAMRRGVPLSTLIKPSSPNGARVSLQEWKNAILAFYNVDNPNRNPMLRVYINALIDNTLTSIIETRVLKAVQKKFNLVDEKGNPNEEEKKKLEKKWFRDFIKIVLWAEFKGMRLAEIFEFDEKGELKACKEVNQLHVIPSKGIVVTEEGDETGRDYLTGNQSLYYIPIGNPDDIGLLYKVAPHILAKKFAIGHWSEFNEKFGIPFRTVHQKSNDAKRAQQLAIIMHDMGSAGWAVLQEDERVEFESIAGTDPTKCFEGLINMLNAEAAMLIMGQSSTANSSKEKGTYGSMKMLYDITRDRHESDLTNVKDICNDVLFPRLATISPYYAAFANLKLDWDESEELTVTEIVDLIVKLINTGKYMVSGEVVTKKVGFEITETNESGTNTPPNKPPIKKKSLTNQIEAHYNTECCKKHPVNISAAKLPNFEEDVLRVARTLYEQKQSGIIDIEILRKTANHLKEGILGGYGKNFTDDNLDAHDKRMLQNLDRNVYVFSGFKTYQQLREITDKLKDAEGNVRPFNDFKKDVLQINQKYNVNWLKAEYDHAVVGSQMASQWQEFQRNKDVLPYLIFDATVDDRTTQTCLSLDKFTARVDDPIWDIYFLPLHFHERSVIRASASGKLTDQSTINFPDIQPMFKNNIGKNGVAFPESHPYYEASRATSKEVLSAVDKVHINPLDYKNIYTSKSGGTVDVHKTHKTDEVKSNTSVAKLLADNNHNVKLLPYSYEPGVKNPDATIDNLVADFKKIGTNTQGAIQNAIKKASSQTAEIVVITLPRGIKDKVVINALYASLLNPNWNKNIKNVWFIRAKNLIKVSRAQVFDKTLKALP